MPIVDITLHFACGDVFSLNWSPTIVLGRHSFLFGSIYIRTILDNITWIYGYHSCFTPLSPIHEKWAKMALQQKPRFTFCSNGRISETKRDFSDPCVNIWISNLLHCCVAWGHFHERVDVNHTRILPPADLKISFLFRDTFEQKVLV